MRPPAPPRGGLAAAAPARLLAGRSTFFPTPHSTARPSGAGRGDEEGGGEEPATATTRRRLLASAAALPPLLLRRPAGAGAAEEGVTATPATLPPPPPPPLPPFTSPGPYAPRRLPALDHVCADLAPACVASPAQCAVTLELWVPGRRGGGGGGGEDGGGGSGLRDRGGLRPATPPRRWREGGRSSSSSGATTPATTTAPPPRPPALDPHPALPSTSPGGPPFPLAVITGGFLVGRAAYASLAAHLASWGVAALVYDRGGESAFNPADDLTAADVLLSVLDFIETSPALSQVAATRRRRKGGSGGPGTTTTTTPATTTTTPATILVGHSRGAKVSVLAAARDAAPTPRIAALGLLDPVNVTRYAPQSPRFPSATAALVAGGPPSLATLPVAIVGGGWAHDCAPLDANYDTFYAASRGPTWMTVLPGAGHFQFVGAGFGVSGSGGEGGAAGAPPSIPGGGDAPFLQRALCAEGPASGEAVRAAAAGAITAWSLAVLGGGVGGEGAAAAAADAQPPPATTARRGGAPPPPPPPPSPPPFAAGEWLSSAEAHMRSVLGGDAAVVAVRKGIVN